MITQIKDIYGNSISDGLILVGLTTIKNTIKNFIEYISLTNLKENHVFQLDYHQIKEEISSLNYSKFLINYKENPNMTLKEFNRLFPGISNSNFYYWRNKVKKQG